MAAYAIDTSALARREDAEIITKDRILRNVLDGTDINYLTLLCGWSNPNLDQTTRRPNA